MQCHCDSKFVILGDSCMGILLLSLSLSLSLSPPLLHSLLQHCADINYAIQLSGQSPAAQTGSCIWERTTHPPIRRQDLTKALLSRARRTTNTAYISVHHQIHHRPLLRCTLILASCTNMESVCTQLHV